MALAAGSRIGSYEIVEAIGAGGMGEVYRARDAKLARDVAIKVLPAAFALDPDRLARFSRRNLVDVLNAGPRGAHETLVDGEFVEGKHPQPRHYRNPAVIAMGWKSSAGAFLAFSITESL